MASVAYQVKCILKRTDRNLIIDATPC